MALVTVGLTYNPTPISLVNLLTADHGYSAQWATKAILVLAFGLVWWIFLRTAYRSLKGIAIAIGAILFLLAYVLIQQTGYNPTNDAMTWIGIAVVSILLGIGATASHVKMRWAGVRNVDEVEE